MKFRPVPIALGLAAALSTIPVFAAEVVTSIKPLELLVKAVAGDQVQVTTLVPVGASPHNYTMKPSQRRALEQADRIFWVGPEMETFLGRLLGSEEFEGRVTAFTDTGEASHHHHAHHHGHHHDHGDGNDPHIWTDPALALGMARDIHARLITLEELDRQQLDSNLVRFEQGLARTDQQIRRQLATLHGSSLFAYHSAFERFANHYGLSLEGVLTLNPELTPGARHVAEVQHQLHQASQPCLLTEPQFNRQWWQSITEGLDITFSTWDPLATEIASTGDGYLRFLQSVADAALACLPEQAEH
ncbi:MAG TPA: zinc ABC transporter substrate-binding protein [Marinobacter sp.]|nr:zinc ABC transporter substrate-binding protein [Marinobacter sp.]